MTKTKRNPPSPRIVVLPRPRTPRPRRTAHNRVPSRPPTPRTRPGMRMRAPPRNPRTTPRRRSSSNWRTVTSAFPGITASWDCRPQRNMRQSRTASRQPSSHPCPVRTSRTCSTTRRLSTVSRSRPRPRRWRPSRPRRASRRPSSSATSSRWSSRATRE